ncbi:hypothetical protein [Catenulispora sp. GAS73]|uniref:hypothetical protein n=1 Tax=Catenulispora sp. GAS73 TaxID=3156269 RepID=UPI003517C703
MRADDPGLAEGDGQADADGTTRLILGVVLAQHQGPTSADDLRAALATSRTLIHGVGQALSSLR